MFLVAMFHVDKYVLKRNNYYKHIFPPLFYKYSSTYFCMIAAVNMKGTAHGV